MSIIARNDVYEMCIDRSSYYSRCRFCLNLKKVMSIIRVVLTVPDADLS